jgi:hypothetical protein
MMTLAFKKNRKYLTRQKEAGATTLTTEIVGHNLMSAQNALDGTT